MMAFEGSGNDSGYGRSPGGFEFGVQGWSWGPAQPKSITFFLDGSAMVCDQYGRVIRRAVDGDMREVVFADRPPDGNREDANRVTPRPQFATHAQVIAALTAEGIDWTAYEVRWRDKAGSFRAQGRLTLADAGKRQAKLLHEGCTAVMMDRTISCAGWPQLPYEQLKKLNGLPTTDGYDRELRKITDSTLRKDALKMWNELVAERTAEMAATE